ncbi:MAG: hypothetical protein K2J08_05335, partial [Ruminococcus sp.]|nr:hypothetical protein [Ruminococcus sp.]
MQILKVRRFKESRIASTNRKCVLGRVEKSPIYRKIAVYGISFFFKKLAYSERSKYFSKDIDESNFQNRLVKKYSGI